MKALVCEKGKFKSKKGEEYFTCILTAYNDFTKDYRIVSVKDSSTGKYVPKRFFVPEKVYESIFVGHVFDFTFVANPQTGVSSIDDVKPAKFD